MTETYSLMEPVDVVQVVVGQIQREPEGRYAVVAIGIRNLANRDVPPRKRFAIRRLVCGRRLRRNVRIKLHIAWIGLSWRGRRRTRASV